MLFRLIRAAVAWGCAGAAGAAAAHYLTESARGTTRGAPGYTKALSTLGKRTGGSMREGVWIVGATAAVGGAVVYRVMGPSAPRQVPASSPESATKDNEGPAAEAASPEA